MRAGENDPPLPAAPPKGCVTADGEPPGLPGFRSWRGVYLFVIGSFVLYLLFLTVFSRAFS
jgi:hypothetical protein